MREYRCPECAQPFSTRRAVNDHRYNDCTAFVRVSDHDVPPEMGHLLGSAVEEPWESDADPDALWI